MRLRLGLILTLLATSTFADEKQARPWANGVSAPEQASALNLFRQGNVFFEQSQYSQALERYRAAIGHWDHPSIRFNMAVCLINLDQPLEARENLEKALAYNAAPFDTQELYAQALTYRKLLQGRLASLTISCEEPEARVSLDGKELFRAPGEVHQVLLPGEHEIVAAKDGFLTETHPITLIPGRDQHEKIKLVTVAANTHFERRWKTWKPWAVMAAGAAVALVGVGLELAANSDYGKYDRDFGQLCPLGCHGSQVPGSLADIQSRARAENIAGITIMAAGGATLLSGIVLAIVNRERAVIHRESTHARLTPQIGLTSIGVSLSL
jgi:tetratricopeptide (TPR) repeat protein